MQKRAGFTIIELLVAMAIIGIAATVGVFMVGKKIKSARDATRKTDIYEIRVGLEQYFTDEAHYPLSLTFHGQALTNDDGTKTYLGFVRQDPLHSDPYLYTYNATPAADPRTYDLCAYRLENPQTAEKSFCLHQLQ